MRRVLRVLSLILLLASLVLLPGRTTKAQGTECYTSWPSGAVPENFGTPDETYGVLVGTDMYGIWSPYYKYINVQFLVPSASAAHITSYSVDFHFVGLNSGDYRYWSVIAPGPSGNLSAWGDGYGSATFTVSGTGDWLTNSNILEVTGSIYEGSYPNYTQSPGAVYVSSVTYCGTGLDLPTPTATPTNTPTNTPTPQPTATVAALFQVTFTPFIGTAATLFNGLLPFWAIVVGIIVGIGLLVFFVTKVREAF